MIDLYKSMVWCTLVALLAALVAPVQAAEAPDASMLYLRDGDFLTGQLLDCDEANVVRWQMRGATKPFDFPAAALRAVYFPSPAAAPAPQGDYTIELTDGDMLFGSLVGVTLEYFEFDSARLGRLRIERGEIRRLTPSGGSSSTEYRGPNGLAEWSQAKENDWRDEAGRLITKTSHAMVQKQLAIPAQARIEFEIAWGDKPEFTLVLSSGTSDAQLQEGFRFEVWQQSLVLLRALGDHADVAIVCKLDARDNRIQLEALVDRELGRMSIHALDGKRLAAIDVPPKFAKESNSLEWLTLTNGRGELRFERLAVSRWSGQLPPQIDADRPGLYQADGTIVYGDVIGYDADARQFILRDGNAQEQRVAAAQVACIFPAPAAKSSDCSFRVALHDGSRLSGELTNIAGEKIYLSRRGVEEPLACAFVDVRSLVGLSRSDSQPEVRQRLGRLELDGVRSHGSMAASPAPAEGTACFVWQPRWSTTSSPLDCDASGRIVYRDPPPPPPKVDPREPQLRRQQRPQPVGFFGQIVRVFTSGAENQASQPKARGGGTLYLLAGDQIPCEGSEIDDVGVHFKSSVVAATFVPHSEVKALELASNWTAAALAEVKRQRLLTLPRIQKDNPPTHLVASTGGDFLRTRLTSMSADTLVVESRLEAKRVPRNRVACLIWLQDAGGAAPEKSTDTPLATDVSPESVRVQAIRADGVRLTFAPQECTGDVLIGASKLLGACRVDLMQIDALVLGSMIDRLAGEEAFQAWKLTNAAEPRYLRDEDHGGEAASPSAIESGLIGKPAPDFRLDLLEGGQFKLADQKGHVVVLDFWASWCGPCMQAMPQVDSVVAEFAAADVKLVAVNLQEDRAAATSALERLKINPAVALDVDGAAAEHYQVTAIPQTVVIDAKGNVARLFIGSDPDFPVQLRTAIKDLLTPAAP